MAGGGNTFGSQVSAARSLARVFRFRCRCRASCPLSSVIDSALYSVLHAALHSVLQPSDPRALRSSKTRSGPRSRPSGAWCGYPGSGAGVGHPVICPLSSIQSSSHFGWRVSAPGGRWRAYSIQSSTQSSTLSSIQSSGPRIPVPSGPRKHVRVPGLGRQVPGTGFQVQVQVSGILSSVIDSALYSALNAALCLVLPLASLCLFRPANRSPPSANILTSLPFPPLSLPLALVLALALEANVLPFHSSPGRRTDAA